MSDETEMKEELFVGKVFTDRKLWLGSMLGGPLVAGYIIYKNFQVFKESGKAKITIIISILFTIVLFAFIPVITENINVPNQLIPLLYTGIAWGLLKSLQGNNIEKHINNGGQLIGWGNTFIVSILGLIITLVPVLILYMILL